MKAGTPLFFQTVSRNFKLYLYVGAIAAIAVVAFIVSATDVVGGPPWSGLLVFMVVALLLELGRTQLRHGAQGSFVFVIHLAGVLCFGPFWGGGIVLLSAALNEIVQRHILVRATFNTVQKALATVAGMQLYLLLGGTVPFVSVEHDLLPFVAMSVFYFSANSLMVSMALAINTGESFVEIWNQNTRGSFVYDLLASGFALLVSWLYSRFGAAGLVGVLLPVVVLRNVYGMYHQVQGQTREMLELMVKAIEARDPYTSGHSVRVSAMSRAIATEMKLPYGDVEQVATAALLHDVGKIHEKFAPVLRKEARLTPEEQELLQEHPVKSSELVGVISAFRGMVQTSVRSHHERWDGNGYPDGLTGEAVPLGARIIAVADTVDAMRTDRPYRPAATYEETVRELERCRGSQFDPSIIDVALNSMLVRSMFAAPQEVRGLQEPSSLAETPRRQSSGWMRVLR